jgi:hypothetical protein
LHYSAKCARTPLANMAERMSALMFNPEELLQIAQKAREASNEDLAEQAGLLLNYRLGFHHLIDEARKSELVGDGPLIDDKTCILLLEQAIKRAVELSDSEEQPVEA